MNKLLTRKSLDMMQRLLSKLQMWWLVIVRSKHFLVLSAFVLFIVISTLYWLYMNRSPYPWDPSYYLETSELMYRPLRIGDFKGFWQVYQNSFDGTKAPLIAVLYLPATLIVGHGKPAIAATMVIFEIVVCYSLYFLAFDLTDSKDIALFSVIILHLMPLTIGLENKVFVEYPLMLLIILWIMVQLSSKHFASNKHNLLLGVILGFGLLLKVTFPLFVLGPILMSVYLRLKEVFKNQKLRRSLGVLLANAIFILIPVVLITSSWYGKNLTRVLAFASSASFGDASRFYSIGNSFWESIWLYLNALINLDFSIYWTCIALALGVFYAISNLRGRITGAMFNKGASPILWTWLVIPLVVFSIVTNKDIRFPLPVLPALSILISAALWFFLSRYKAKYVLVLVLLFLPIYMFVNLTYLLPWQTTVSIGNWVVITPKEGFAGRPDIQAWPYASILKIIYKDTQERYSSLNSPVYVTVLPDHESFNNHTFSYYARLLWVGPEELLFQPGNISSIENWLNSRRDAILSGKYIITKTGDQGVSWNTAINDEIMQMLDHHELPFKKIVTLPLPDGSVCSIYRKIEDH